VLSYIKVLESKVEAQREKDLEKAEAQRKSLELKVEAVEAQREKDIEKVEMQREKDLSDANDRKHKFKLDLEGKIECLERRATERDLVQKQADELRSHEAIHRKSRCPATDFLAVGVCLLYFHSFNLLTHISI
jgi:hypothetical protein